MALGDVSSLFIICIQLLVDQYLMFDQLLQNHSFLSYWYWGIYCHGIELWDSQVDMQNYMWTVVAARLDQAVVSVSSCCRTVQILLRFWMECQTTFINFCLAFSSLPNLRPIILWLNRCHKFGYFLCMSVCRSSFHSMCVYWQCVLEKRPVMTDNNTTVILLWELHICVYCSHICVYENMTACQ